MPSKPEDRDPRRWSSVMSSDVNLQYQTRDIHRQEEKEVEERHELYNEPLSLDATRLKTVWGLFVDVTNY